mgnify:CR=1
MSAVTPVDIQILGRSLRVNCPADQQEALFKAADDLTERVLDLKQKTRVNNIEQLIFIVALNVCHELADRELEQEDKESELTDRTQFLINKIDAALSKRTRFQHDKDA